MLFSELQGLLWLFLFPMLSLKMQTLTALFVIVQITHFPDELFILAIVLILSLSLSLSLCLLHSVNKKHSVDWYDLIIYSHLHEWGHKVVIIYQIDIWQYQKIVTAHIISVLIRSQTALFLKVLSTP